VKEAVNVVSKMKVDLSSFKPPGIFRQTDPSSFSADFDTLFSNDYNNNTLQFNLLVNSMDKMTLTVKFIKTCTNNSSVNS